MKHDGCSSPANPALMLPDPYNGVSSQAEYEDGDRTRVVDDYRLIGESAQVSAALLSACISTHTSSYSVAMSLATCSGYRRSLCAGMSNVPACDPILKHGRRHRREVEVVQER
jgi:hypothetical protein